MHLTWGILHSDSLNEMGLLNLVSYVLSCRTCLLPYLLWLASCPTCSRASHVSCFTCSRVSLASCPKCFLVSRVSCFTCSRALHVLHVLPALRALEPILLRALRALVCHVPRASCDLYFTCSRTSCAILIYVPLVSHALRHSFVNIAFSALLFPCFT